MIVGRPWSSRCLGRLVALVVLPILNRNLRMQLPLSAAAVVGAAAATTTTAAGFRTTRMIQTHSPQPMPRCRTSRRLRGLAPQTPPQGQRDDRDVSSFAVDSLTEKVQGRKKRTIASSLSLSLSPKSQHQDVVTAGTAAPAAAVTKRVRTPSIERAYQTLPRTQETSILEKLGSSTIVIGIDEAGRGPLAGPVGKKESSSHSEALEKVVALDDLFFSISIISIGDGFLLTLSYCRYIQLLPQSMSLPQLWEFVTAKKSPKKEIDKSSLIN